MKYLIYIKSHCEAPDYEDEVEAKSKKEAVKYFLTKLNRGDDYWDESMIEKEVVSEEEIFKN